MKPLQAARFDGECCSTGVGKMVWRITKPFRFYSATGRVLEIPEGFITDFASVPSVFWPILPVSDGEYDPAAVGHDFAVRNRKLLMLSLVDCHRLFLEMLRVRKVSEWKCLMMYRSVYLFNWLSAGEGDGQTPKSLLRRIRYVSLVAAD